MINTNLYIVEFISGNWMAMTILLTLLKGIAMLTKSTIDDKVVTMLSNLLGGLRSGLGNLRSGKVKNEASKASD